MGGLYTCCLPTTQPTKDTKSSIYTESSYLGFSYKGGSPGGEVGEIDSITATNRVVKNKDNSESFSFNNRQFDSKKQQRIGSSSLKMLLNCEYCGNAGCRKCLYKDSFT